MKKETKLLFFLILLSFLFVGCNFTEITVEDLTEEEIEVLCEKTWHEVENIIGEEFLSSSSPSELEPYFSAIRKMDYVEDVVCTETSVDILLKNGCVWSWLVKDSIPTENIEDDEADEQYAISKAADCFTRSIDGNTACLSSIFDHKSRRPDGEKLKILIFDQTSLDESEEYQLAGQRLRALAKELEAKGAEVIFKTTNYKIDDLDEYDLCLLHTHGTYIDQLKLGYDFLKKRHSILTSSPISFTEKWYHNNWTTIEEKRGGRETIQTYYTLSENDIESKYSGKFKKRGTFLFVTACHSLEENDAFAKAFINCGASGYIGYTNVITAYKATKAAESFFLSLLNDRTINDAYTAIPYEHTYLKSYRDKVTKETIICNTKIGIVLESDEVKSYCYGHICPNGNHPHLIDMGNGLKWSCCNVGASDPYSAGNYYSWGETKTKSQYSMRDNVEYASGSYTYPNNISCTSYDVAWVTSNGTLRMPSHNEFKSLISICDVSWADFGSHGGAILTSKLNGNKLFISAGGWNFNGDKLGRGETGILWTSDRQSGYMAYFMQVLYNDGNPKPDIAASRWSGHNVRGVAVSE